MGLDPRDMPRVNVNLPAAPRAAPDPNRVTWPSNANITVQPQSDDTVLVSWPAAHVGSGAPLQYLLYVKDGATWDPVQGCDQSATSCRAKLDPKADLYVIAINTHVSPPSQTPQLCFPSTNQCGVGSTAPATPTRPTPLETPTAPATAAPPATPAATATRPIATPDSKPTEPAPRERPQDH
jgi:hypothetical protein